MKDPTQPDTKDFRILTKLMAILATSEANLSQLQAWADQRYLGIINRIRAKYSAHQQKASEAYAKVEAIARRHPEWFTEGKTLKTPHGTVRMTDTSAVIAEDEAGAIVKLEAANRTDLVRVIKELDKEALEKLSAEELEKFGITKVPSESCKIKPTKIDLGKAIKSIAATEAKAQDAA